MCDTSRFPPKTNTYRCHTCVTPRVFPGNKLQVSHMCDTSLFLKLSCSHALMLSCSYALMLSCSHGLMLAKPPGVTHV